MISVATAIAFFLHLPTLRPFIRPIYIKKGILPRSGRRDAGGVEPGRHAARVAASGHFAGCGFAGAAAGVAVACDPATPACAADSR